MMISFIYPIIISLIIPSLAYNLKLVLQIINQTIFKNKWDSITRNLPKTNNNLFCCKSKILLTILIINHLDIKIYSVNEIINRI